MSEHPCACTVDTMNGIVYCPLHQAAGELLEALKKMKAEVAAVVGISELRPIIGNTNFSVLIQRWDWAQAAIERAEGTRPEEG